MLGLLDLSVWPLNNTLRQRKNFPIECAQGDQSLRCPNRVFLSGRTSLQPFHDGDVVTSFDVVGCRVR